MKSAPPTKLRLDYSYRLRLFRTGDAKALALAVGESLEHLRPWMPWADDESADERFQRQRLRGVQHKAATGEEWQYGLFPTDESRVLGSFGLMTRQGPGTIEIGYWVHVDEIGHGLATLASARAHQRLARARRHHDRVHPLRRAQRPQRGGAAPTRLHARGDALPSARGARRVGPAHDLVAPGTDLLTLQPQSCSRASRPGTKWADRLRNRRILVLTLASARSPRNGHGCQAGAMDTSPTWRSRHEGWTCCLGRRRAGGGPARPVPSPGATPGRHRERQLSAREWSRAVSGASAGRLRCAPWSAGRGGPSRRGRPCSRAPARRGSRR